ncbi:hypothetical protein [Paenibacillus sp. FSL L8-0708]|uniref:hypothetical protein n=1 Tax=Paenibacillus sp. FSL L8-0708 TaxID=2975311 RepID=UPI0030F7888B
MALSATVELFAGDDVTSEALDPLEFVALEPTLADPHALNSKVKLSSIATIKLDVFVNLIGEDPPVILLW